MHTKHGLFSSGTVSKADLLERQVAGMHKHIFSDYECPVCHTKRASSREVLQHLMGKGQCKSSLGENKVATATKRVALTEDNMEALQLSLKREAVHDQAGWRSENYLRWLDAMPWDAGLAKVIAKMPRYCSKKLLSSQVEFKNWD